MRSGRPPLSPDRQPGSPPEIRWPHQFLLFALIFAGIMLIHAPLLRLPYFWDEAGYYIPAARDLLLSHELIPHSTPSNAHPPLVMAWLALAWRVAGYSTLVTRTAMLVPTAFSLLGFLRLARRAANLQVAWTTTALLALYPVFFTQSSLAQIDLPAAGFTFWGLLAYLEGHPWRQAIWFSLAALTKETAILAPLALLAWELCAHCIRPARPRWHEFLPPAGRLLARSLPLALPVLPLAIWFAYHYEKTGYLLGNPEFFRYNVAATLNPLRIPLALGIRLWQVFGYFGLYFLTLTALLAMFRRPQIATNDLSRPRIALWMQTVFLIVLIAYLGFLSAVGGAVLTRYLLPVVPLVMLIWVSTLWRRLRYWRLAVGVVAIAFVAGLFTNPPYGFSLEDNLAYRDYIVMHAEAARFLALRYPRARVLTAWPASDELTRPWLGYISQPIRSIRIEDFSAPQVALIPAARGHFDVVLAFSTKYQPPHPLLEDWEARRYIKERFFGYHRDLAPEEVAGKFGGRIVFQKQSEGQWIAVIAPETVPDADLQPGHAR